MAFYSTIPSSGLMQTLRSHEDETEIQVWDSARIEAHLLTDKRLRIVFERYFPQSFKTWKSRDTAPTQVFATYTPLECAVCGKDLLVERSGNVALAVKLEDNKKHILDVYWACRGNCDRIREQQVWRELDAVTTWEDIADLSIPLVYVRWFIATFNNLRDGRYVFTDEAFEKFKHFTPCMLQIVVKETTTEQWQRIRDLVDIPSFLGGLG